MIGLDILIKLGNSKKTIAIGEAKCDLDTFIAFLHCDPFGDSEIYFESKLLDCLVKILCIES